jgi:NitT/TauT family transport system ATP-binding protein
MERPFVEISDVAMRYGGVEGTLALQGTTLSVRKGEFVAVVGPSGCGKSTLMRLVTGLWPCTAGSVVVAGHEVAGPLSVAGMAFQNPTLLPWRNILDNVMLPLEVVEPHRPPAPPGACGLLRPGPATCWPRSASAGSRRSSPGSSRAACSSAPRLCRALIHEPSC